MGRFRPATSWLAAAFLATALWASPAVAEATEGDAPLPPWGLVATPGDGVVRLSWQEPLDDGGLPIESYIVYRGASPSEFVPIGESQTTQFIDDLAVESEPGTLYWYGVAAANAAGTSEVSAPAAATQGDCIVIDTTLFPPVSVSPSDCIPPIPPEI